MSPHAPCWVQVVWRLEDPSARRIAHEASLLGIRTGAIRSSKVFVFSRPLDDAVLAEFSRCLADPILQTVVINDLWPGEGFSSYVRVSKRPGVTDDEGATAQKTLCDFLNVPHDPTQWVWTEALYYLEASGDALDLGLLARETMGNELVHLFDFGPLSRLAPPTLRQFPEATPSTQVIPVDVSDEALCALSAARLLALNLEEMRAIRDHFLSPQVRQRRQALGMPVHPTDCELEILAQTWSEHCKHKEFNALITYRGPDGTVTTIDSLFSTFIRAATQRVRERLEAVGAHWLLSVFSDNAGVVRANDRFALVWKVETHNSPSALDPYGGALTGIVGVNRDPMGTGVGGARCLFNTNVLCFGNPHYQGPLLPGQLHPRRIMAGVVKGIEDGGNKSGIPTVNGAVVFDDRYMGKPLVYCGTAALLPLTYQGRPSWVKRIEPGDRIVMAGGRVGRDGIHGATFSSQGIGAESPRSAVQIGSPFVQKNLSDFLEDACAQGLVRCSTDNGAGGLSSSVGELARLVGGATVWLERVPLKYPGLAPWEIFLSESQERMTLAVPPDLMPALCDLAARYEVEVSDIGVFHPSGALEVWYGQERVAYLDLGFLHEGVPRKHLEAEWVPPPRTDPVIPAPQDYSQVLLSLLCSLNICSREPIVRRYDHEVKGRTVIKPLMGPRGLAPQDAAVVRLSLDSWEGVAVACGIIPRYGDLDPYQMSAGSFDEAVRSIVAVGGSLPDPKTGLPFWSVNDNFCMPDSAFDPVSNPDGKLKLGKLVRMCEALYDMATAYCIPLTSGKDSMKNDLVREGVKISVPPTVLYSAICGIPDVRATTTAEFKAPGDAVYVVGRTAHELGGSEFFKLLGLEGGEVPVVRPQEALSLYRAMSLAQGKGLVASCHDVSDGGLAVALAESAMGAGLGLEVDLRAASDDLVDALFSESHSRFVVSVQPAHRRPFEEILGAWCAFLGWVTEGPRFVLRWGDQVVVDLPVERLLRAWRSGLEGLV